MAYLGADMPDLSMYSPDSFYRNNTFGENFEPYGNDPELGYSVLEPLNAAGQLDQTSELVSNLPVLENSVPDSTLNHTSHWLNPFSGLDNSQLPNIQDTSNPPSSHSASMNPPSRPRKRKAPTLRAEDWEPYKARIMELHNLPLTEIKDKIEQEYGFKAECVLSLVCCSKSSLFCHLTLDFTYQGCDSIECA